MPARRLRYWLFLAPAGRRCVLGNAASAVTAVKYGGRLGRVTPPRCYDIAASEGQR